jgi:RNA polymerase sigma factor (sigma-70 family)
MICDISSEAAGRGQSNHSLKLNRQVATTAQRSEGLFLELQPILDGLSTKFANGDPHLRDDLNQVGALAVFRAMQRFKPRKGTLACYAARCAKGAMLNHRRWLRKFNREVLWSDMGFENESDDFSSHAWNSMFRDDSAEESLIAIVDGTFLRELAASVLTVKERNVISAVFFDGYLQSEAAATLEISAPRVTQLLQSALDKLKIHLMRTSCAFN